MFFTQKLKLENKKWRKNSPILIKQIYAQEDFADFHKTLGVNVFALGVFSFLMRNFKHLKARVYLQTCFGKKKVP